MYDYHVTCSYDEVLRFKKSAAVAAAKDISQQGISDAKQGLVHVVTDNFDTDIFSANGKLSTHSLAMIITQPTDEGDTQKNDIIRRLQKDEMSQPIADDQDTHLEYYSGQKKPMMPSLPADFQIHVS